MIDTNIYNTKIAPNWCPGCGNFGIWNAYKNALAELNLGPHQVVFTYDIGCSGNMADKLNTYGFKTLHGRTIAVAVGIKLANPNLKVIATGGDGGIFEEGINHLIWAARSNYDITVVMHNNNRFALTTGQPTTTTNEGQQSKTSPFGVIEKDINPIHLALISNAPFVARAYAGNINQLVYILKEAINFNGFAFVEVLQPCVTYNQLNTFEWYSKRVYDLSKRKSYNPSNWNRAFSIATDIQKNIATGIIYKERLRGCIGN